MNKLENIEYYYNKKVYDANWPDIMWNGEYNKFLCIDKSLVELCLSNADITKVADYINSVGKENNITDTYLLLLWRMV